MQKEEVLNKTIKRINTDNERKLLSFLLKEPHLIAELNPDHFREKIDKALAKGFRDIYEQGLEFSQDTLLTAAKKYAADVEYADIQAIAEDYKDFTNWDFHKKKLHNDYVVAEELADQGVALLSDLSQPVLNSGKLEKTVENLSRLVQGLKDSKKIVSLAALAEEHKEILVERMKPGNKRTIGYNALDNIITKPCHPGQVTFIFGMKGSGKSTFLKAIENSLINKGVAVGSFNLEMDRESCLDTLLCMRVGKILREVVNPSEDDKKHLDRELEKISEISNYMLMDDADLTIAQFDEKLSELEDHFLSKGVITRENNYFVAALDLISMLREFDDEEQSSITQGMNAIHRVLRKKNRNVHLLAVGQANENKIRGGKIFSDPEQLDSYKLGLEDIRGGDGYAARSRVVISIHRPVFTKMKFFPEQQATWEAMPDVMNVHVVKQNQGPLGFSQFIFPPNYRIASYKGS